MKNILVSMLIATTFVSISMASTIIPGGNVNGVWNQAGSPYLIQGYISIQIGDQLVIEPGCSIEFTGHYDLSVLGRLVAVGTDLESIQFDASNASVGWHGIRFLNTTTNGQDASTLTYCVFQNGRATGPAVQDKDGGAISCLNSADVLVSHCTLLDNYADDTGGALYLGSGSDIMVEYSEFIDNQAFFSGGAIDCDHSSPLIVNTLLESNSASVFGGGISGWNGGHFRLENVRIINNVSGAVAGFYSVASNPVIVGCLIAGNTSTLGNGGGGGITSSSVLRLINTTISENQCAQDGGGVWIYVSSIEITNSIIWANSPNSLSVNGSASVAYTDVAGGWAGIGNLDLDPEFVGSGPEPYALAELSPCIDTASPDTTGLDLPDLDLAGNPRIANGRVDMGAFEYTALTGIPAATFASLQPAFPNPFNPQTQMSFSLPWPQFIEMTVYDLAGLRIGDLARGNYDAGEHASVWDGRDAHGRAMPSGTYLVRLKTDAGVQSQKVVLVR
jgi:hypothetical protein